MASPARHDRPVRIFLGVVAVTLVLSVIIPFAVVSLREGSVGSGARWVWDETGIVGALIGCALVAPFVRRWRPGPQGALPPRAEQTEGRLGEPRGFWQRRRFNRGDAS